MPLTAETWPVTAALLQFPAVLPDGTPMQDAEERQWVLAFREIAEAGFSYVDLTDSWIKPGNLSQDRLDALASSIDEAGISAPVISAIRCSVIDSDHGDANLAYSHRTIDAAARLGVRVISFGLHQALTPEQQRALWFWTVKGHVDPAGDREVWSTAVSRFQELGRPAADADILLSLELYEDTYLGTAESAVNLVTDIGMRGVGLNPDVGNLIRLHRPVERWQEVLERTLPYSNYWHVKNYARDENTAKDFYSAIPASLENGLVNYREAFRIALAAGFQGIICAEHYGGDGLAVSATNQDYLRRHVLPKTPDYELGTSFVTQSFVTKQRLREGESV